MIHFILIPEIYLPFKRYTFFIRSFTTYVRLQVAIKMRILGIRHFMKSGPIDFRWKVSSLHHFPFVQFCNEKKERMALQTAQSDSLLYKGRMFTYSTKVTSAKVVHQDINQTF